MGGTYDRVELHEKYGGVRYRGIAPTSDYPYVFPLHWRFRLRIRV